MKKVRVRYVAALRDHAGLASEEIATDCDSAGALYASLRARHGFSLQAPHLRVAINDRFASMDSALSEGDEILFVPPVAGG